MRWEWECIEVPESWGTSLLGQQVGRRGEAWTSGSTPRAERNSGHSAVRGWTGRSGGCSALAALPALPGGPDVLSPAARSRYGEELPGDGI